MTWEMVPIADVLLPQANGKVLRQGWSPQCLPTPAPADAWGVLKTTAIQAGAFLEEENKELPSDLPPRPDLEVKAGDLLITCAGPRARCGIPTLVRNTRPKLMMSGKIYRMWVNDSLIDPRFLEFYLLSDRAQKSIDLMKTGISDSGLNLTHQRFSALPVPVTGMNEQRRIVEFVEEQLSHLDAADAALATSKERANKLWGVTASQLLSQADHSLTPLQELLREPMRNGRSDRASANGEGIRCLTLTAVTRREFSDRWTKIAATAERTAAGLWLEPGDIFVQRSNTPELVGTSALYEGERHWAIFPDLLIRVRPDEKRVDRHFLAAALRSEACHRQLRKSAKGLAGSMPKIDQSALGRLPIPVPAMEQQKAIASQLMELEIDVLRMAHAIEAQSARCAALRRAVLAAAFSGRLTGSSSDTEIIEATAAAFPSPAQETLL